LLSFFLFVFISNTNSIASNQVMVQLKPNANVLQISAHLSNVNATHVVPAYSNFDQTQRALIKKWGLDRYYTVHLNENVDTSAAVENLRTDANYFEKVESINIGGVAHTSSPSDFYYNMQWNFNNSGQYIAGGGSPPILGTPGVDINMGDAWWFPYPHPIRIAIVDSGVSPTHPDFNYRMGSSGPSPTRVLPGWNTIFNNSQNTTDADCPHGTHVAGIAAALTNSAGVAGIASNAEILPVKVVGDCGGTDVYAANGVLWATDHGANVINMSLQYYGNPSSYFQNILGYAHDRGVFVATATGNAHQQPASYPALYDYTLGVGAINALGERAVFSNYGSGLDLMAPGESVFSTFYPNLYAYISGTSMASPHLAGIAALMLSRNSRLSPDEITRILKATATPLGESLEYGSGLVNAERSIRRACIADFNVDGRIDNRDMINFRAAFQTGDIHADVDLDGALTVNDFMTFLNLYGEGCGQ
jgi:hypothetical protein